MFVIWGSRGFVRQLGTTNISCTCSNCSNDVTLISQNIGRKFTLFWIPLFKLQSKYYAVCPICDYGYELTKKDLLDKTELNQ